MFDESDHCRDFRRFEYTQIGQLLSSGYQTMALLLTLFFAFNGALIAFVAQIIGSSWGENTVFTLLVPMRQKSLAVCGCAFLAITMSYWAATFVRSWTENLQTSVRKASEIEVEMYGDSRVGALTEYKNWLADRASGAAQARRATTLYFIVIFLFWIGLAILSILAK